MPVVPDRLATSADEAVEAAIALLQRSGGILARGAHHMDITTDHQLCEARCGFLRRIDIGDDLAVAQDGGDITFHGFDRGVVYLHMQGACAGCPSSTLTLKMGIENLLRHYIPEVLEVRPVAA